MSGVPKPSRKKPGTSIRRSPFLLERSQTFPDLFPELSERQGIRRSRNVCSASGTKVLVQLDSLTNPTTCASVGFRRAKGKEPTWFFRGFGKGRLMPLRSRLGLLERAGGLRAASRPPPDPNGAIWQRHFGPDGASRGEIVDRVLDVALRVIILRGGIRCAASAWLSRRRSCALAK